MPTYQYRCMACREPLEVVQAFSDAALTACPSCDGRLRKVFSSVGVVFKGSGFYQTDSRPAPKADPAAAKESDGAKSPAPAADGAKSDGAAKPAAKSAEKNGGQPAKKSPAGSGSHKVA